MKETENQKKLRIAFGKCTRLEKEIQMYQKEEESEILKIKQMHESNEDIYDIRQMDRVLEQTRQMIPRVNADYKRAVEELGDVMADVENDPLIADSDILKAVREYFNRVSS